MTTYLNTAIDFSKKVPQRWLPMLTYNTLNDGHDLSGPIQGKFELEFSDAVKHNSSRTSDVYQIYADWRFLWASGGLNFSQGWIRDKNFWVGGGVLEPYRVMVRMEHDTIEVLARHINKHFPSDPASVAGTKFSFNHTTEFRVSFEPNFGTKEIPRTRVYSHLLGASTLAVQVSFGGRLHLKDVPRAKRPLSAGEMGVAKSILSKYKDQIKGILDQDLIH
jgi:hypothetical protein